VLAAIFALMVTQFSAMEWRLPDWLLRPSATDWMQAVGTLATTAIALLVYRAWRKPDDARRRADTAQIILRQCAKLEVVALACRETDWVILFHEATLREKADKLIEIGEKPPEKLPQLEEDLNEFETFLEEIQRLFGDRAAELARRFAEHCRSVLQTHRGATTMGSAVGLFHKDDRYPASVDKALSVLDVRYMGGPVIHVDLDINEDSFRSELKKASAQFRSEIVKFLVEDD
jgi:hypothetical protein